MEVQLSGHHYRQFYGPKRNVAHVRSSHAAYSFERSCDHLPDLRVRLADDMFRGFLLR
jgi:hypothetical protein